ncbi:MAG: putative bifunctional diguanylate cyclase/phosphodiesterase, partial [Gammaproteobacteria bacterium]
HHAQARRYFSSIRNNKRPRDEIDFLYESAEQLSHQLEENTLSLAAKNRELAEERDFVQNLLASAQVLVITQTKNGVIRICNAFMADLVGCAGPELYGRRFVDLIADGDFRQDIQSQLQALCESDLRRMEHEDDLICANGERRKVVWVHTPLRKAYIDGTAVLSVGMDITERVRAESKMRWLANNDPLTSLTNRHSFIEHLTRYYETAQHGTSIATLLLFDLDHFKEINDTSGHAAGDDLLRTIAQELKSHARKSDIVARLGGDEFAVLMPQTDPYGAEAFAKHLNERLSQMPFVYGEKRYRIGASIGIAFLPQHGANAQEAMANADLAMFEAKRSGRSRTHVYSEDLQQSQALTQNVYWKDVLTQAMETEQLIFYYQPVVDIQTGRTCYCEALLRLRMADGRIAAPGEFLPTAERSGLIYALDCYVVSILLKDLLKNPHKHLSINLSTAALNDFGWTTPLIDAVKQEKLDPKRVIFEITETAVIADVKKAKQIVQAIIDLGFEFSVDDFGAGFSSLYYLKQLPVHCVKIDQSLVKDIVTNQEDHDFVQALVTMIHVYGKKVVVEGVEDLETLNLLKDMHVDMVQGYYLGRPNPGYVL